ncbi:hypothetical protein OnM2_042005 [Erysiphe neolycopersici]|uniref:Conserved oligomeric Golgi complex subunit 2 n=1 Tax=Erysiphe neolycopersici TaxID=212602 RepID=A0A420HVB5_9PEZI|nr:hypothetical protein OnM2_042005 [Erysiphe neolycopersici]
MNQFGPEDGLEGDSDDENHDNLPYPEALLRSDFLSPDFDASKYLSSLSDRHQTLEDLQSDLRERSQLLSKELLDLVNSNHEQFLNLGSNLKGGEEQLEDIRVSLLGFKSGVLDIRAKVHAKKTKIERLICEKGNINRQITFGRKLLEVDMRLEDLEDRLASMSLGQITNGTFESHNTYKFREEIINDENQTVSPFSPISLENLHWLSTDFCSIESLMAEIGTDNPFIIAQKARMIKSKNEIFVNLRKALIQNKITEEDEKIRILKLLTIYRELGAANRAINILREFKLKE